MNYEKAGVNIDVGNVITSFIAEKAISTFSPNVLKGIGSFCSFYSIKDLLEEYPDPVIVSSTDGVGTKLKLATELNNHNWIGYDLVGMCVNDILTCGATPLFFLDYFATGKLDTKITKEVLRSIVNACKVAHCSLVGGETAEMPGLYQGNDYDIAGFAVGIVNKPDIIDGSNINVGDVIIGIESNGLHSNGYSLVRQVFKDENKATYNTELYYSLEAVLLAPTAIYVGIIKHILKYYRPYILGMAHITGGGFYENIPRILPKGLGVIINKDSWDIPTIFKLLQKKGDVSENEMWRVFNMGIGYILVVKAAKAKAILFELNKLATSFKAKEIGTIIDGSGVTFL